jgi:metallo-beta-lactamase family protein
MKLTFHGAARTVTGSQHLLEVNGHRILLDCGLYQGKRKVAFEMNRKGFCDGSSIDLVILSHAHIDHSGNIPCLAKNGFRGDILSTSATRDLCATMLLDSAHIQEHDVAFVNKRRKRQGKRLFEPLYTKRDAVRAMELFVGQSYGRRRTILPGVDLTLVDAGHMLGSASVILDIRDKEIGRELRLVFSGDIGRSGMPIIRDPVMIEDGADVVLMESTYGNRLHPPLPESEGDLERVVNETHRRGGCLLIPAFAVGRTQQIVYTLHRLHTAGKIPSMPIYVDSPLATNVTDAFRLHPETYDEEIRQFIHQDDDRDPFGFANLRYTRSVGESKALNSLKEPAVIISASGMMEAGRILHHLRNRIEDPRNTILVTGWQAPNTLGRRIVEGAPTVRIFGEERVPRAKVEILTGFSGHADREGLLAWAGAMKKKPSHTFLVHGEEKAAEALADGLRSRHHFERIRIPAQGESFTIGRA